jgi:hypothetical protein
MYLLQRVRYLACKASHGWHWHFRNFLCGISAPFLSPEHCPKVSVLASIFWAPWGSIIQSMTFYFLWNRLLQQATLFFYLSHGLIYITLLHILQASCNRHWSSGNKHFILATLDSDLTFSMTNRNPDATSLYKLNKFFTTKSFFWNLFAELHAK